jgi:riboflavin kinase/FMN adenylyltransferase
VALRLIHGWRDLDPGAQGGALALGNFDGVHRGHQQVIAGAAKAAAALPAPLGVITFEPHPRRWFQPDAEPFRLMTLEQQARALEALGVERLHVLPFEAELAAMSDEAFAEQVLHQGLAARHVAVGFDITFGAGRSGDPETMRRYGERFGFGVSVAPRIDAPDGVKLSSSAVRAALAAGRPEAAAVILGRPFAIEGVVQHGDKRGRTIGFPTANILLGDYVQPAFGVYATRSRLPDGREITGVANLGRRPTVEGTEARLEVWLFDFDEDLYGVTLETDLVSFLRPERRFDGLDALKTQIAADAEAARALLLPAL